MGGLPRNSNPKTKLTSVSQIISLPSRIIFTALAFLVEYLEDMTRIVHQLNNEGHHLVDELNRRRNDNVENEPVSM
jgi:hypothetical protein